MNTTKPRPLTPSQLQKQKRAAEAAANLGTPTPSTLEQIAEKRAALDTLRTKRRTERAIQKAAAVTWPEVDRRRDQNLLVRVDLACRFRRVDDRPLSNFGSNL